MVVEHIVERCRVESSRTKRGVTIKAPKMKFVELSTYKKDYGEPDPKIIRDIFYKGKAMKGCMVLAEGEKEGHYTIEDYEDRATELEECVDDGSVMLSENQQDTKYKMLADKQESALGSRPTLSLADIIAKAAASRRKDASDSDEDGESNEDNDDSDSDADDTVGGGNALQRLLGKPTAAKTKATAGGANAPKIPSKAHSKSASLYVPSVKEQREKDKEKDRQKDQDDDKEDQDEAAGGETPGPKQRGRPRKTINISEVQGGKRADIQTEIDQVDAVIVTFRKTGFSKSFDTVAKVGNQEWVKVLGEANTLITKQSAKLKQICVTIKKAKEKMNYIAPVEQTDKIGDLLTECECVIKFCKHVVKDKANAEEFDSQIAALEQCQYVMAPLYNIKHWKAHFASCLKVFNLEALVACCTLGNAVLQRLQDRVADEAVQDILLSSIEKAFESILDGITTTDLAKREGNLLRMIELFTLMLARFSEMEDAEWKMQLPVLLDIFDCSNSSRDLTACTTSLTTVNEMSADEKDHFPMYTILVSNPQGKAVLEWAGRVLEGRSSETKGKHLIEKLTSEMIDACNCWKQEMDEADARAWQNAMTQAHRTLNLVYKIRSLTMHQQKLACEQLKIFNSGMHSAISSFIQEVLEKAIKEKHPCRLNHSVKEQFGPSILNVLT